jgi:hypothetical protein
MKVERKPPGAELIDVLDRVLDKGTVVDASARLRLAANDMRSMHTHVVVDSMDTCVGHVAPGGGKASKPKVVHRG